MRPATQADIDAVADSFREGERRSEQLLGRDRLDSFEQCWAVEAANGDLVGYFGVCMLPNESVMGRGRAFCFMSCEAADRHKLAFVKATRPAFKWVAEQCPPWVDMFVSWPLESYAKSVRWQEKVLGMRRVATTPVGGGENCVILELTRKEMESWDRC